MRLCASLLRRRRGPAGLRDLFRFCRNCGLYALRSGPFRVCEAMGGITTLGAFHTFRKPCVARCQNGKLCRFWVLAGCALEERRKPSGQRCAYACRCPEASRPRWAA